MSRYQALPRPITFEPYCRSRRQMSNREGSLIGPRRYCAVMEQIPPPRRVIRLFPDYSRDYPLWENSTPTWDVGYTTTPETYGLSAQLREDLAGWQAFWEAHADPFEG